LPSRVNPLSQQQAEQSRFFNAQTTTPNACAIPPAAWPVTSIAGVQQNQAGHVLKISGVSCRQGQVPGEGDGGRVEGEAVAGEIRGEPLFRRECQAFAALAGG